MQPVWQAVCLSSHLRTTTPPLHIADRAGAHWCISTGRRPPHPANPRAKVLRASARGPAASPEATSLLLLLGWGAGEEAVHWPAPPTARPDIDTQMPAWTCRTWPLLPSGPCRGKTLQRGPDGRSLRQPGSGCSSFPLAVTNYHKLGDLKQHGFDFLTVLVKSGLMSLGWSHLEPLGRIHFLACPFFGSQTPGRVAPPSIRRQPHFHRGRRRHIAVQLP